MIWKKLPPKLSNGQFRRLTGVKRGTFNKMCFIIKTVKEQRRKHPNTLQEQQEKKFNQRTKEA
jgi:hypothetical protein